MLSELTFLNDSLLILHSILALLNELLLSFSALSNFNAICNKTVSSDSITCLHGLRTICMFWIIFVHACIDALVHSNNPEFSEQLETKVYAQAGFRGAYTVDTFFFISGFLAALIYLRGNTSNKRGLFMDLIHFFGLIISRFLRLTIPYMFVLGLLLISRKYFDQNSVFDPPFNDLVSTITRQI